MNELKEKNEFEMGKTAMKLALSWYGFGSPVGIGILIVSVGAFLVLLHYAGIIR